MDALSHTKRYLLAAALGAVGGGLVVIAATRAIPRMMSGMMAGMMKNMMGQRSNYGRGLPDG